MGARKGLAGGVTILVLAIATGCVRAQEPAKGEEPARVIGGVKILANKEGLEIEGKVCMQEGILDFLAVVAGGREYESVLALNCEPKALHAALLAMGAKPGPTPGHLEWLKKEHPEDAAKAGAQGSQLVIDLEWKGEDGKSKVVPATEILIHRKTRKSEDPGNPWIFTGSEFFTTPEGKKVYGADANGAVISVTTEDAVIGIGYERGDPYAGPEEGFEVNPQVAPKAGTGVLVHIRLKK